MRCRGRGGAKSSGKPCVNTVILFFLFCVCCLLGAWGELPSGQALESAGVQAFASTEGNPMAETAGSQGVDAAGLIGQTLEVEQGMQPALQLIPAGTGLPALPKKVVAKMLANEYIDFAELPPARGKSRSMPQSLEGQVIVVQAADLLQTKRVIPDLATWAQCFAIYVAVVGARFPKHIPELMAYQAIICRASLKHIPELMAYQAIICRASLKYRWPSWVVYDQNFRQEAAGNPAQSWAKVDPSTYAQCFTGQALSSENWCQKCQCLDHTTAHCPYRQRKRPWNPGTGAGEGHVPARPKHEQQVCIKYNKFNGDCKFGRECRFLHVCSTCREPHPVSRCKPNGGSGVASANLTQ